MANREALRDLHARLADRLRAAKSGDVAASWLAVFAAGNHYLFPLAQAGEIFPWTPPLSVPYSRHWFLGVANLRGGVYGVVDLAAFVSGSPRPPPEDLIRNELRLVTFNAVMELNCGLLVDRLDGLRHQDAFVRSDPAPPQAPEFFGTVFTDAGGTHWQEINLQTLARHVDFLSISA
jgi:twitching motility protein PilI